MTLTDNLLEVKKQKLLLALEAPSGSGASAGDDTTETQVSYRATTHIPHSQPVLHDLLSPIADGIQ